MDQIQTRVHLHVVFAGRGDSLILDYHETVGTNQRRWLILVDGGPTTHRWTQNALETTAPYYRYLMSTLRTVWGDNSDIHVAAIINSHPDDDHYAGLLELLKLNLRPNRADFSLDGSFFVPYWPIEGSFLGVQHTLRDLGFEPAHARDTSFQDFHFLNVKYPKPADLGGLIVFNRGNPITNLDQTKAIKSITKAKDKNDGSILMEVLGGNGQNEWKSVFFTGDGSAERIKPEVVEGKKYLIYKIQHHGSQENQDPSWDIVTIDISPQIQGEYMLRYLLLYGTGSVFPLFHTQTNEVIATMAKYLRETVVGLNQVDALKNTLADRHREYVRQALTALEVPQLTYINDVNGTSILGYFNDFCRDMTPNLDANTGILTATSAMNQYNLAADAVDQAVKRGAVYQLETRQWFNNFAFESTLNMFSWINRYGKISQFYSSFEAKVYVVSGSATIYGHPSVATLMGLALAAMVEKRAATLYMTDPGMLFARRLWKGAQGANYPDLKEAAEMCGLNEGELFAGNNLNVCYLSHNISMTLDATVADIANRDVRGTTERIVKFSDASQQRKIYDHLKQTAVVLPISDTRQNAGKQWNFVAQDGSNEDHYLTMRTKTVDGREVLEPSFTDHVESLYVREHPPANRIGADGGFTVTISSDMHFNSSIQLTLQKRNTGRPPEWRIRFDDGQSSYKFVKKKNNVQMEKVTLMIKSSSSEAVVTIREKIVFTNAIQAQSLMLTSQLQNVQGQLKEDVHMSPLNAFDESETKQLPAPDVQSEPQTSFEQGEWKTSGYESMLLSTSTAGVGNEVVEAKVETKDLPEIAEQVRQLDNGIPFRQYLEMSGFDPDRVVNRLDAMFSLVGRANDSVQSITNLGLYSKLLRAAVDLESSVVDLAVDQSTGYNFNAAMLLSADNRRVKFRFGDEEIDVIASTLILSRRELDLDLSATIKTSDGLLMALSKKIPLRKKLPTLRDFLVQAGADARKLHEYSIATIFSFIFEDQNKAIELFCSTMPARLLEMGLPLLKPDLDLSTVSWDYTPLGLPHLFQAKIPCELAGMGSLPQTDLSVLKITVTSVAFELNDPGTAQEKISFVAGATAKVEKDSGGVELLLRFDMTNQLSEIHFTARKLKSIGELTGLIPVNGGELLKMPVPLTKPKGDIRNDTDSSSSALGDLTSSEVGFTVREVHKGSSEFALSSVFVAVNFDDWKEYLPGTLSSSAIEDPKARVTVINPTLKTCRARVEIAFLINVATKLNTNTPSGTEVEMKQNVAAEFTAEPLGVQSDYDFRLNISCPVGISVVDVARVVGLDLAGTFQNTLPIMDDILNNVQIQILSIGAELQKGKMSISDWTVGLVIEEMPLIPDEFVLQSTEMTVSKTAGGLCYGDGRGQIHISKLDKDFTVEYKSPQPQAPGFVEVQICEGLTLDKAFSCVDVELKNIPVIGDLVTIPLSKFRIDFGHKSTKGLIRRGNGPAGVTDTPEKEKKLSLFGAGATFKKEKYEVGKLTFEKLEFSFTWFSRDYFLSGVEDIFTFAARATLPGGQVAARLSYTSAAQLLYVELIPVGKGTVGDLLRSTLPDDVANTFLPVVGSLSFREAAIVINTAEKAVEQLNISFHTDSSIELERVSGAPVSVSSLTLRYRNGQAMKQDIQESSTSGNTTKKPPDIGPSDNVNKPKPSTSQPSKRMEVTDAHSEPIASADRKDSTNSSLETNYATLVITGEIQLNNLKAKVQFKYEPTPGFAKPPSSSKEQPSEEPLTKSTGGSGKITDESSMGKNIQTKGDMPSQVSLSVSAVDKGALSLKNFMELFGIDKLDYDAPERSPGFLGLQVKEFECVVNIHSSSVLNQDVNKTSNSLPSGIEATADRNASLPNKEKPGRFSLSKLNITVESPDPLTILESSPPIVLERLYLRVMYFAPNATPGSAIDAKLSPIKRENQPLSSVAQEKAKVEVLLYGAIKISERLIEVVYRKTKRYGSVFAGRLTHDQATHNENKLDIADFANSFVMPSSSEFSKEGEKERFSFPTDLNLPPDKAVSNATFICKPGELFEFAASGESVWEGNFGDDLKFKVRQLSAYIKISKPVPIRGEKNDWEQSKKEGKQHGKEKETEKEDEKSSKYTYEIHLLGKLSINEFTSVQARLDITPGRNKILTASIERDTSTPTAGNGDMSIVAASLSTTDPTHNWSSLVQATDPQPFILEGSALLFIDFTGARLIMTGHVKNIGQCVVMGHRLADSPENQTKSKYGFYLSLVAQNVEQIWKGQKENVSDVFTIRKVAVQLVSYQTTVKRLLEDLQFAANDDKKHQQLDPTDVVDYADKDLADDEKPDHSLSASSASDKVRDEDKMVISKLPENEPIHPGAWIFAEIVTSDSSEQSSSKSLSSSLALAAHEDSNVSESGKQPTIVLFACMMKDPKTTVYNVRIENLTLLGGCLCLVSGTGTYHPGDKTVSGKRKLDVDAKLELSGASGEKNLEFSVDFYVDDTKTWFAAKTNGPALSQPFGEMFNVQLVDLRVVGTFSRIEKTVAVSGRVKLGAPHGDEKSEEKYMTGMILLDSFMPRAILLEYENRPEAALPIGDLCLKVITTSSAGREGANEQKQVTWPDTHPNFVFESAMIYFVSASLPNKSDSRLTHSSMKYKGRDLLTGYHLEAAVYLFDKPFNLRLDIGASKNKGISFAAVYKDILDLEIVKLSGYKNLADNTKEDGPLIIVKTGSGSPEDQRNESGVTFEVKAGVSILSSDPLNVRLEYVTSPQSFTGTISIPKDFLGDAPHEVGITYKNGRFSLTGLKVQDEFADLADLTKLIREGSTRAKKDCGELVGMVFKKAIKGNFKFGLALPEDNTGGSEKSEEKEHGSAKPNVFGGRHKSLLNTNGDIELLVTWKYDVMTRIEDVLIFSLPFEPLKIAITPKTDKTGILSILGTVVSKNLKSIADQLASNPENLAKLVGVLMVEECGPQIVSSLLCRGAKSEDLNKQGEKDVQRETDAAKEAVKQAPEAAAAAEVALATGAAAAGAGAVAGEGILIGLAIIAAALVALERIRRLKELVAEHGTAEQKKTVEGSFENAKGDLEAAREKLTETRHQLEQSMAITEEPPTFNFLVDEPSRTAVAIDWTTVVPRSLQDDPKKPKQEVTWTIQFSTNGEFDKCVTKTTNGATSCMYEDRVDWSFSSSYFVRIKASMYTKVFKNLAWHEATYEATEWSPIKELNHVAFLKPPMKVVFTANGDVASIVVDGAAKMATVGVAAGEAASKIPALFEEVYWRPSVEDPDTMILSDVRLVSPPDFADIMNVGVVTAFARNSSTDESKFRHSAWALSNYIMIVEQIKDLTASMDGLHFKASWSILPPNPPGVPSDPIVFLINKSKRWINPYSVEIQPNLSTGNRREARILPPMDTVKQGDAISIAICDRAIPPGAVAVFVKTATPLVVDYLPPYTIHDSRSLLDRDTWKLTLAVSTPFARPKTSHLIVRFKLTNGEELDKDCTSTAPAYHALTGNIEVPDFEAPIVVTVQIVLQDEDTKIAKVGPAWNLT
ncbi:MAG: hypothetical protein M1837_005641 [Sclerophora amabilis]|nr:MAG: hypothetical protein M1837_005641 [Sclerophora amabilis]